MLNIKSFTFNPFQENTYIIIDTDSKECAIVDPGCYEFHEKIQLFNFIQQEGLKPVLLLQTHTHVDHVLGTASVAEQYNLIPVMHKADLEILRAVPAYAPNYGFRYTPGPEPVKFLEDGDKIKIGAHELEVLFTPGHSPGSISFYSKESGFIVSGDVLFYRSIGRTDLPGGDQQTLIKAIMEKLMVLPEDTIVYSGHGSSTTIGSEKDHNPFLG